MKFKKTAFYKRGLAYEEIGKAMQKKNTTIPELVEISRKHGLDLQFRYIPMKSHEPEDEPKDEQQ